MLNIAILGAGTIARKMALTISKMDTINAYAIAARDLERAKAFAAEFNMQKAYGCYDDLVNDENVDLIYIATPHTMHYEHAKLCLEHNKNVLCEKPFTVNANQAKELFKLAEEKKCLITEAMWTRYMPSRKMIDHIISSGEIGEITSLTANLGYNIENIPRLTDPTLAGGALLDVGVYMPNFAMMVFGNKIKSYSSHAVICDNGVDAMNSITMEFEGGKMAVMHSSMRGALSLKGSIFGRKGYIEVTNTNNPEKIEVFDENFKLIKTLTPPEQITGFEYEVESCRKAIEDGRLECPEMPHAETIQVLEMMDEMRKNWGMPY